MGGKLKTVLIVPFVLQIFAAVGVVSYLSTVNGQEAVGNLANQLMKEVEGRISERLHTYLEHPNTINKLNQSAIALGQIDQLNLKSMEQHFWHQSQVFDQVSYIQYGNENGEFIGLAVHDDGSLTYQVTEFTGNLMTYDIDNQGKRQALKSTSPGFDPRNRPWYQIPRQANKTAWTNIYTWVNPPTLAITLGEPHYNTEGKLAGILATDLTISQISDFLRTLEIGNSGQTFILERSGLLVATSTQEAPFTIKDQTPKRLSALNSENELTRAASNYLKRHYGDLSQIASETQHQFSLDDGTPHFLLVNPMSDAHGLNWLTVIVVPESDFMGTIHENTRNTILLSIAAAMGALLMGMLTAKWVTRPVSNMNQAAKAIAEGDFNQQISTTRILELGELSHSFNEMASQLQTSFERLSTLNKALLKSEKELADANKNLEQQVHLQTQELVQSEKMAALGQLTAGIAHEINTPLGVIQASSENIATSLLTAMEQLPILLQTLPKHQCSAFFRLLDLSRTANSLLSSREERQLRKKFKLLLSEESITPVNPIANTLSKMGLAPDLTPFLSILKAPNNTEILEAAYQLSVVQNNSGNIRTAIKRVSKIVFALKSYARHDLSSQKTKASVWDSIETVLTLYHNQLKNGIEVTTEHEEFPDIWCYPEELAQVWTNLIHNAIQAMNNQGYLNIKGFLQDNHIVIEVMDSGHGIPKEIRDKIFTPFFTTKPAGEGSGLGLDIVSKIVQKHEGFITVESDKRGTTFQVHLPIVTDEPQLEPVPEAPETALVYSS